MPKYCDVDKDAIKQRKQRATHKNDESKNASQINHNYCFQRLDSDKLTGHDLHNADPLFVII